MRHLNLRTALVLALTCLAVVAADTQPEGLHKLRKDTDPTKLDVLQSYKEAIELEREITQMYREIRAAKLSKIQRQSLEKSLEQTLVPISKRLDPKAEILKHKAKNSDDVKTYQNELKKVMQENDAIVANAEEMLKALLPEEEEEPTEEEQKKIEELMEDAPEDVQQAAEEQAQQAQQQSSKEIQELMKKLEDQAEQKKQEAAESLDAALKEMKQAEEMVEKRLKEQKEEETKKEEQKKVEELKKDLKEAKKAIEEAIESIVKKEENVEKKVEQAREAIKKITEALKETKQVDEQVAKKAEEKKHTEEAVKEMEKAQADMKEAQKALLMAAKLGALLNQKMSGEMQVAQQQILGQLAKANAGRFLDLTEQMKGKALTAPPMEVSEKNRPPSIKQYFKGVPGRKFVREGGTPAVWFYVDDWYMLGPYNNKGRMNIQKVFPPESIIDLDANYRGKDGALMRWVYDSFGQERLYPAVGQGAYTIWYGYTELSFEEPSDLWIAVGSDDRSDLWINGLPVWHSSNRLKGWQIDEGYRKVHFKQGTNKVLFRLENGWHGMGFSLLINTHKPAAAKK